MHYGVLKQCFNVFVVYLTCCKLLFQLKSFDKTFCFYHCEIWLNSNKKTDKFSTFVSCWGNLELLLQNWFFEKFKFFIKSRLRKIFPLKKNSSNVIRARKSSFQKVFYGNFLTWRFFKKKEKDCSQEPKKRKKKFFEQNLGKK